MAFALGPLSDFAPQRGNGVNKNIEIIGQSNGWLHGFNTAAVLFTRQTHKTDIVELHIDRKSTRLNSSHVAISYAVFCLKKKKIISCVAGEADTDDDIVRRTDRS